MRQYIRPIHFFSISPCVKALVIVNLSVWFFAVLIVQQFFFKQPYVFQFLGLTPNLIKSYGFLWQMVTYMFIHAESLFHILFNMLVLWMFGAELERLWGSRMFFTYYLLCGLGAAVIYVSIMLGLSFFGMAEGYLHVPVVGSSGAVFGLMAAYGMIFKDRIVFFMMIFPMRALTFVGILAGVELLSLLSSGLGGPVANLAHLGGLFSGFIFLIVWKNYGRFQFSFFRRKKSLHNLHIVRGDSSKNKVTWN